MLPFGTSWYVPRFTSIFIVVSMIALIIVGIVAINVSEQAEGTNGGLGQKQLAFAGVGLVAFVIAVVIHIRRLARGLI